MIVVVGFTTLGILYSNEETSRLSGGGLVETNDSADHIPGTVSMGWRWISATMVVVLLLIVITSRVILQRIFFRPIVTLTEWFRKFQKGEGGYRHPLSEQGDLLDLANEVEQVALNLHVARKAVVARAQVRQNREEIWTEDKLRNLIHAKMGNSAFFVVSNREPFMHVRQAPTGAVICLRPASGVVTAIDPILRALGGTWVAHGAGDADQQYVNSRDKIGVPPEDNKYILKRVWLSKEEEQGYYYGFSNEGLWPLCHITHTRPVFRETDWVAYQRANHKFADALLEELPLGSAFVFVQDYHFTLLPAFIKARRPDVGVALFWHIPWPPAELFALCPYQKEILNGMLACDLIGFHVQYHCNNFMDTASRLLECRVNTEKFSVVRSDKETLVRPFPISIAPPSAARGIAVSEQERLREKYKLSGKIVAIGVDRLDYTKGIGERILAVDRFLEKYPEFKGKFVFIQVAAPTRTHIKTYQDFATEIDALAEKVNLKQGHDGYSPIIYLNRLLSAEEIAPFYALADICIVSALHDGMNLVAKEYVSSKKDSNGVLLLSCFTGAARELADAIIINPYAIEEFAEAIHRAATMSDEDKVRRMASMRRIIEENNVYRWAGSIVTELAALKK